MLFPNLKIKTRVVVQNTVVLGPSLEGGKITGKNKKLSIQYTKFSFIRYVKFIT